MASPANGALSWRTERRRLGALRPQPDNPRKIGSAAAGRLRDSMKSFGQVDMLACGPGGEIYNGHQRHKVWLAQFGPDHLVDVRVSSRPLAREEWGELTTLLHEGAVGRWSWDGLANWSDIETGDLRSWGFSAARLGLASGAEVVAAGSKDRGGSAKAAAWRLLTEPFLLEARSVLDARLGWWRKRKEAWIALGIKSELGRGDMLLFDSERIANMSFYQERERARAAAQVRIRA